MSLGKRLILVFVLSILPLMASPAEIEQLCRWRAQLEQMYHNSRLPPKKPFEEEFPPSIIINLVAADLRKERILGNVYGVRITREMLEEEIRRIEQGTKDADKLARIKAALGPDGQGFAEIVARPIIVERLLRLKFYQDKTIHAAEREKAISSRRDLIKGKKIDGSEEQTLLLGDRPVDASAPATNVQPSTLNSRAPSYTNFATAQIAQVIRGAGQEAKVTKHYLSDLDPELAAVLKKHLQKPGDITPIVEDTSGFSIYQVQEITADHWQLMSVFIPRKSYDSWLASQADPK